MKIMTSMFIVLLAIVTTTPPLSGAVAATEPSSESALAAEQEVMKAMLANDADAVGRLLSDDWVVINTRGGVGNRAGFLAVIRSGDLKRTTMDLSNVEVRVYGKVAIVTAKISTSGTFMGKSFDIQEQSTDVLAWQDGSWKSVLTHETEIRKN